MKFTSVISLFLLLFTRHILAKKHDTIQILESMLQLDTRSLSTLQAFEGIIFQDFYAEPKTQRFNGSLAVGGTFSSDGFIVNMKNMSAPPIQCIDNTTTLDQIGLYVQGDMDVKNTTVNGAMVALEHDGTVASSCVGGPISMDFEILLNTAVNVSRFFAEQVPTLVLRDGGYLSDGQYLGKDVASFYTLTFDPCHGHCEVFNSYLYSDPSEIFFSSSNWTGPYNTDYLIDKPIVFNIPVRSGSVFHMSTDNPAAGLEDAFVIYNVYPVTEEGEYDPTGFVVWIRDTIHTMDGFILAPGVHLIESNAGGFNGNLVTSRYLSVFDIHNYIIRFFTE